MDELRNTEIFTKKYFIKNINCKLAKLSNYKQKYQILSVCTEQNDILNYLINDKNTNSLKLINWFRKTSRQIQDMSFHPNGLWLAVLCTENTIHIVPVLSILDKSSTTLYDNDNQCYSINLITSYVIPFIGPHECAIPQRCPNNIFNNNFVHDNNDIIYTRMETNYFLENNSENLDNIIDVKINKFDCPIPTSIIWWQTIDKRNRAVIGYTDGSVCCVALSPNCPFIASMQIKEQSIEKLFIFKNNLGNVTLLINTGKQEQYKLILELKCINYIYPGDISPTKSETSKENSLENWQFVLPKSEQLSNDNNSNDSKKNSTNSSSNESSPKINRKLDKLTESNSNNISGNNNSGKLIPSTKGRLSSLKNLGSIKLNAIKMKLAETKPKNEDEVIADDFTVIDPPNTQPDLIKDNIFELQNLKNTYLLSSLNCDILKVHGLDTNLLPLFQYKILNNCNKVLISSNLIYLSSINADNEDDHNNVSSTLQVLSSALAAVKGEEKKDFNQKSILAYFNFENETILNIFHKQTFIQNYQETNDSNKYFENVNLKNLVKTEIEKDEINFYSQYNFDENGKNQEEIDYFKKRFPKINFDPCFVITNKNIYYIDLNKSPFDIFVDAALSGLWQQCEEFCNIFDMSFVSCIELTGDYLLHKNKVTQALYTYNIARIPPIKTALKLAIHRETYALMHLCALALKINYIIKSKYLCNRLIKNLLNDVSNMHAEDVLSILPKPPTNEKIILFGESCSDFKYSSDENYSSLQMTTYSQFHLSNLLIITLAEKAVKDKNYVPLWNYIVTNTKYHTNMTSIVLAQSGLYSSALLLAMTRGSCLDVFLSLISVINQEFGYYSELNVCLYTLTDPIFTECFLYMQSKSTEYFQTIQKYLPRLLNVVLNRLEQQLNPFKSYYRPILSYPSIQQSASVSTSVKFIESLIETYISVIIQIQKSKLKQDNFLNAFKNFQISYEDNQFAIDTSNFLCCLSVGCTNAAYCVNGVAYFWGSHGMSLNFSSTKSTDTIEPAYFIKPLEVFENFVHVHAVKCGRQHSIILTNNGVYSMGVNQLGQLGIGERMLTAMHPMLIDKLDGKNILIIEAGQYHNAIVDSDGIMYTWGWGIYGQLGLGSIENQYVPKPVYFFRNKKVISVSLGHAHTLVLCALDGRTALYTFGSNHYGQLGTGSNDINKSLIPIEIYFDNNVILINTKFFSNLIVTENNELFTWGASPQALRLANQLKRRSNAKLKVEENLKKEIQKRILMENEITTNEVMKDIKELPSTSFEHLDMEAGSNNKTDVQFEVTIPLRTNNKTNVEFEVTIPTVTVTENNEEFKPNIKDTHENFTQNIKQAAEIANELTDNHMNPHKVDIKNISGNIIQVSTGLFHYALITSTRVLYTWGKNLEHQLGTQDKDRKTVTKPSAIDCIDNPLHVECGADFTLVMTSEYSVKAFGGNSNGQCGRDLNPTGENKPGRLFCLPTTKRLLRLDTHCIETPHEINLPRPYIYLDKPVRYFKSVPKYNNNFLLNDILSPDTNNLFDINNELALNINNIKITNNSDDDDNDEDDEDDECSILIHNNTNNNNNNNNNDYFINDIKNNLNNYIHYCLYIFHGIYNPHKIIKLSDNFNEFQIRILLLNSKYYEAFSLSLNGCLTSQTSIKIFEYFTKDTSNLPIKRNEFKYYICRLFNHFIIKKLNLTECENFFLSDLDYYLNELSFVLYFNNFNQIKLEKKLNIRFKNIINSTKLNNDLTTLEIENSDQIFEQLSIKFKTIICKHIIINYEN